MILFGLFLTIQLSHDSLSPPVILQVKTTVDTASLYGCSGSDVEELSKVLFSINNHIVAGKGLL